jgi:hypothetical protein
MTARRRGLSLALFALLLPACLDLSKDSPVPLFIDDFETGKPTPEFQPWSCDTDGGPGGAAGGQSVSCAISDGGGVGNSAYELRAHFVLEDPPDGGSQPIAEVVTRTTAGKTVDLTGFTTLFFSTFLEDDPPPASPLPTGTELQVGLGCAAIRTAPLAFPAINGALMIIGGKYPDDPFQITLSADTNPLTKTQLQTCLRQVDSVRFTIKPQDNSRNSKGGTGTLHLDNIELE